jgi:hypothetical protein
MILKSNYPNVLIDGDWDYLNEGPFVNNSLQPENDENTDYMQILDF